MLLQIAAGAAAPHRVIAITVLMGEMPSSSRPVPGCTGHDGGEGGTLVHVPLSVFTCKG